MSLALSLHLQVHALTHTFVLVHTHANTHPPRAWFRAEQTRSTMHAWRFARPHLRVKHTHTRTQVLARTCMCIPAFTIRRTRVWCAYRQNADAHIPPIRTHTHTRTHARTQTRMLSTLKTACTSGACKNVELPAHLSTAPFLLRALK